MTRDPENVKAIFVTHASSFEIGASRYVPVIIASAWHSLQSLKTHLRARSC